MYIFANLSIEYPMHIGKKWALLVNRSTTTYMVSWLPWFWVMLTQSPWFWSHLHCRAGRGFKSPLGHRCSTFIGWHIGYLATNSTVSFFIHSNQKLFFKSWYVLLPSGWMVYLELCASSRIFVFNSQPLGIHILPLNLNMSSWLFSNSEASLCSIFY